MRMDVSSGKSCGRRRAICSGLHARAHRHGDGAGRHGALQEAAARGHGSPGKIHLGKLGKMRTANAVTHDMSSSISKLGERIFFVALFLP
jgi:hypothetical protein